MTTTVGDPTVAIQGPDVLGVLLTHRCNIVCRHCCNDSHPAHSGAVDFQEVAHVIEMARTLPSIREVGISGGEPFLFVPLVLRIIKFASELGFSSSITTNGFWANSRSASQTLEDFAAAGLRAVCISTSVFHQEFIDLKTVIAAAKAALRAGLVANINLVETTSFTRRELASELGDMSKRLGIVVMPCLPAGRGRTNVQEVEYFAKFAVPHGNCSEHFRKLVVDTTGDLYPCCSPGGFTGPLRMGNVKDAPLYSLFENSADNQLLAILESVGPQFFLPFLRASEVGTQLPERFSDQCHLCQMMLSSDACATVIRQASEQLFSELDAVALDESSLEGDRLRKIVARRLATRSAIRTEVDVQSNVGYQDA
jgi:MoaA/NifB/PqqE/SkfB family radical SAM enzyme